MGWPRTARIEPVSGSGEFSPARVAARCWAPVLWVTGFSLLANLLVLSSSLYMMQVYDRVIPSGSLPTLLFLSLIARGGARPDGGVRLP